MWWREVLRRWSRRWLSSAASPAKVVGVPVRRSGFWHRLFTLLFCFVRLRIVLLIIVAGGAVLVLGLLVGAVRFLMNGPGRK
uniref:Uncharacterized protein n=1 Tax=Ixodes ricinus TaxID=34613 RepID=A0A6B0TX30_IXORI